MNNAAGTQKAATDPLKRHKAKANKRAAEQEASSSGTQEKRWGRPRKTPKVVGSLCDATV